jgi:hypothetical protein
MRRNEKRQLAKVITDLNTALKRSLEVTESAVATATATQALLERSLANAESLQAELVKTKARKDRLEETIADVDRGFLAALGGC